MGQEQRLVQIVVNLVNNASHATAAAGGDRAPLEISSRADGGNVVLRVRDHGVGMTPAVKARLFEPFFTTKPQGQGTGLGLSISYQLAIQMGGTLAVDSTPGEGTTVSLALPSCVAPLTEATRSPDTAAPRLRLLVVDDEPLVLRTLSRTLAGHDVVCCNNAQEALDVVAARADFDVVLCDVMMPAMDGPALRRELLRRHPRLAGRFVFVTGAVTGLLHLDEALKDIPMLAKPVDTAELRARVLAVALAAGPRSA
jgi:CheY-like chemotaxis protein